MRPPRLALAALALLSMLTTACEAPEPDTPTAAIATNTDRTSPPPPSPSPDPSPSPSPEDFTIPEVIDEAYVQRVLQTLYSLESEAARLILDRGQLTTQARAYLEAAYRPEQIPTEIAAFEQAAAAGFPGVREEPGDQLIQVLQVLEADSSCIFVSGDRDFSQVLATPHSDPGAITFFQLREKVPEADPEQLNPTPWMLTTAEVRRDGVQPEDPCDS